MKFILGTAALGTHYGVANEVSKFSEIDGLLILQEAARLGVNAIDTAPVYGSAENTIGMHHLNNSHFEVHTKISLNKNLTPDKAISSIEESIAKLKVSKIGVLYFHSFDFFLESEKKNINAILKAIQESGYVKKLGISTYQENEIEHISENWPQIQVFQVPENILDRRLIFSDVVNKLHESGKEFLVRSIFLQGLLLMETNRLPEKLIATEPYLRKFDEFTRLQRISRIDAALSYLSQLHWPSGFLVGVSKPGQLSEIVEFTKKDLSGLELPPSIPYPLIDPRHWEIK